jgi:hypothetical protein
MPGIADPDAPRALRELDADSPALDAVGVLAVTGPDGLRGVCTGTLIGPSSVLTAAGCWQVLSRTTAPDLGQGAAVFAIGPDPREPLASAAVVEAREVPDTQPGGPLEVLHLAKPLAAVPAARLGFGSPLRLGQTLVRVGYAPAAGQDAGQRRIAPVHLTALREQTLEVAAANSGDNSAPCRGPGEPLLRVDEAGELVLYAVASDVAGLAAPRCDHGTVYTGLEAHHTRAFIEAESHWTDPCAGVFSRGECVGEVVRRCSGPEEGERRIAEQDCREHGLTCLSTAEGAHCAPQRL